MHRLLVLAGLAVAILTIPALAGSPETRSPLATGFKVSDTDAAHAAAYWTPARMAAASEMPLPLIRGVAGDVAKS
jgi:hypothetical protein